MKRAVSVVIAAAMAIFVRSAPADDQKNGKKHLQLVEATIDDLQDALKSRLVTSERLVRPPVPRVVERHGSAGLMPSRSHREIKSLGS